jgi:polysaccharide biosynthesis protein PslA
LENKFFVKLGRLFFGENFLPKMQPIPLASTHKHLISGPSEAIQARLNFFQGTIYTDVPKTTNNGRSRLKKRKKGDKWPRPLPSFYRRSKQLFDPFFALFALIVLSPLFFLISLIVKLTSPGPIFYMQERIGQGGKPFYIYKFRSMYEGAESLGPLLSKNQDPRITRWGKFMRQMRLDELPQFYNVLIGDMAIIGPRPERKYYIDQILQVDPQYKYLLQMKPGITSWGQVRYGYAENVLEMVERLQYDIHYLKKSTPILDLLILVLTIKIVLQRRGQ